MVLTIQLAGNSVATIVATRVLTPKLAVAWAAFFNFIAFLFFGVHVANTIGTGIVSIAIIDKGIVFGALIGACSWNFTAWYLGLPTSSSHALIGGMIGAAMVKGGIKSLLWGGIIKTVSFIIVSPVAGLLIGSVISIIVYQLFQKSSPSKVDHFFRTGQL
ncbi:MAG: inorganic phosphate transporter, partial [Candidatus Saganbacteria bacterium]|nr:inorganic phosphate transporter [Candidatus Saganbacteria bacterium]